MSKTKIVATIGPASDSPELITEMIRSGVNVFRFNTKHADVKWHKERIKLVRSISKKLKSPVGVMIDLQGPEIRIETPYKRPLAIKKDEEVIFAPEFIKGKKVVKLKEREVYAAVNEGDVILIDDGYNEFVVTERGIDFITTRALDDYVIGHRKSLNIPGAFIDMPSLTERDFEYLDLAKEEPVDFVALSFVRSREDVLVLKHQLQARKIRAGIISKVEGAHAIENIDEIIEITDAVMVARGDLGVEIPIEQITYWQKKIINKCRTAAKPVITATEMLQSMIEHSRPTRAEVSDVANAVFDGTDAVMLSGESASGKHPVKAVSMMDRICEFNEDKSFVPTLPEEKVANQTKVVTRAVMDIVSMGKDFKIDVAVVFTETGRTARDLARFRPHIPVYAVTEKPHTFSQLTLVYGVRPHLMKLPEGEILEIDSVIDLLKKDEIIEEGNRVVFVHGDHWKIPGLTNTITIKEIV